MLRRCYADVTFHPIPLAFTPFPFQLDDEPKKNQGTTDEFPTSKKCFLLTYVTFWVPKCGLSNYK